MQEHCLEESTEKDPIRLCKLQGASHTRRPVFFFGLQQNHFQDSKKACQRSRIEEYVNRNGQAKTDQKVPGHWRVRHGMVEAMQRYQPIEI